MRVAVYLHYETLHLPAADARFFERAERVAPAIEWIECQSEEEFLARLPDSDAAMVWRFENAWLEQAPHLAWIATPAAGREFIRVLPREGLKIMHGTFHGEIMGETVLGLMLAFARGIHGALIVHAANPWPRGELSRIMRPIRGGQAVILGFGHIGKWIGRMLKPFGLTVIGVNRTDLDRPDYFTASDIVVPLAELDAQLPTADHLILALPATGETDAILNEQRLRLLPAGAYVYNVGRGNAIDETALAAALSENRLAGAGLDVYHSEPLAADSPLRGCGNVILLPHVSAMAPNYLDLFLDEFLARVKEEQPALRERISAMGSARLPSAQR